MGVPLGIDPKLSPILSEIAKYIEILKTALGASPFRVLTIDVPWNPVSLTNGSTTSLTVNLSGVSNNDIVVASLTSITAVGWQLSGSVIKPNTIALTLTNHTGGTVDLGHGIARIVVLHK